MNNIEHILDIILNKPLYLILIISLILMIAWSLIKKLYKLAIIFGICCGIYIVYIYIENPKETEKQIKESIDSLGKEAKKALPDFEEQIKKGIDKAKKAIK